VRSLTVATLATVRFDKEGVAPTAMGGFGHRRHCGALKSVAGRSYARKMLTAYQLFDVPGAVEAAWLNVSMGIA
jgi:hypothetical protein